jgi:hypothetical protein
MSVLLQSLLDEKEDLVKEKTQLAELVSCNCLLSRFFGTSLRNTLHTVRSLYSGLANIPTGWRVDVIHENSATFS